MPVVVNNSGEVVSGPSEDTWSFRNRGFEVLLTSLLDPEECKAWLIASAMSASTDPKGYNEMSHHEPQP